MSKKPLFSVTKKDFEITFFSGHGAGGQHRNRHMNCVRLKHIETGIITTGTEERSLEQNKRSAFRKLIENKEFMSWLKMKTSEAEINIKKIEKEVDEAMKEENLLIEYF